MPWDISSLICCLRLVDYFSLNLSVLSSAVSDILSLLYLLDTCCVYHTHLANPMWVQTHTPMLFISLLARCKGLRHAGKEGRKALWSCPLRNDVARCPIAPGPRVLGRTNILLRYCRNVHPTWVRFSWATTLSCLSSGFWVLSPKRT